MVAPGKRDRGAREVQLAGVADGREGRAAYWMGHYGGTAHDALGRQAVVHLHPGPETNQTTLVVVDNGRGFAMEENRRRFAQGHRGVILLSSLEKEGEGVDVQMASAPREGTAVRLVYPIERLVCSKPAFFGGLFASAFLMAVLGSSWEAVLKRRLSI